MEGSRSSYMKTVITLAFELVAFALCTQWCGKSIDKREWGNAVAMFLLALGLVLIAVKNETF
jgi:hypothetical protein